MEKQTQPQKPQKRVLMLADFACATGFAQVAQNIVKQLLLDQEIQWQIDIVGINYHGMPNEWQNVFPQVRLFPAYFIAQGDVFGRKGYLTLLASGAYDITFILQDTFNIEVIGDAIVDIRNRLAAANQKVFKFIFYFPIDATPKENWLTKSVAIADIPVSYTKYGYDETVKILPQLGDKLRIIPHGVDPQAFFPLPEDQKVMFKRDYFNGMANDRFIITNLNRNQPRKDIMRTMMIFAQVKKVIPNALLYLHMKNNDVAYTIDEVARNFELIPQKDYITPQNFDEHDGFPTNIINGIYNVSDIVMTTTLGEGWGLSMTEAMAAGVPVVAPNHTSLTEMIGEDRGFLVAAGRTINDWIMLQADNERTRPIVSVADFVETLINIHNNPEEAKRRAKIAYEFILANWTWEIVGKQWQQLFKDATITAKIVKIGRNDSCYCGSGKKYKNCHLNG